MDAHERMERNTKIERCLRYVIQIFGLALSAGHAWLPEINSFLFCICGSMHEFEQVPMEELIGLVLFCQAAFRLIFVDPLDILQNISTRPGAKPRCLARFRKHRLLLDLVADEFNQFYRSVCEKNGKLDSFVPFVIPPLIAAHRAIFMLQYFQLPEASQEKILKRASNVTTVKIRKKVLEKIQTALLTMKPFCYEYVKVRETLFPEVEKPCKTDKEFFDALRTAAACSYEECGVLAIAMNTAGVAEEPVDLNHDGTFGEDERLEAFGEQRDNLPAHQQVEPDSPLDHHREESGGRDKSPEQHQQDNADDIPHLDENHPVQGRQKDGTRFADGQRSPFPPTLQPHPCHIGFDLDNFYAESDMYRFAEFSNDYPSNCGGPPETTHRDALYSSTGFPPFHQWNSSWIRNPPTTNRRCNSSL